MEDIFSRQGSVTTLIDRTGFDSIVSIMDTMVGYNWHTKKKKNTSTRGVGRFGVNKIKKFITL